MTGGWGSNLLDRLGIHYWTAPNSVCGAVDFIDIGGYYYNVADFFIISCTPLFLLAAGYQVGAGRDAVGRGQERRAPGADADPRAGPRGPDHGRHARRGELWRRERCCLHADEAELRTPTVDSGRGAPYLLTGRCAEPASGTVAVRPSGSRAAVLGSC